MVRHRLVRLRLVSVADFRLADRTIWHELESAHRDLIDTFRADDVAAVRSGTGSQVMFLSSPVALGDAWVYRSERLRLDRGSWNPLRLADYASAVGLELANLPSFDDVLRRLTRAVSG